MKFLKYCSFILCLFLAACSGGLLEQAQEKFDLAEYQEAISLYEKALAQSPGDGQLNFLLAESYRRSNRLKDALPYYEAALDAGNENEAVSFFHAFALKENGQYQAAEKALDEFLSFGANPEFIAWAEKEKANLATISSIKSQVNYYDIDNLTALNTAAGEYGPSFYKGDLYFVSTGNENTVFKTTGGGFSDLMKAAASDLSSPSAPGPLGPMFNKTAINEGSATFSPDGKIMVFARGNSGQKGGTEEVNLYISRMKDTGWTEPQIMGINAASSWDSCPAFSINGKTLYFASNRPGGSGGIDLYSATVDGRGNFSKVRNMGATINTPGNDMFPYVDAEGRLFFASSGHTGFGGLDLFKAVRKDGTTTVSNLGPEVNSAADDFGLVYANKVEGYFTSNREGGQGDDDIYYFYDNNPDRKAVNYVLKGVTYTKETTPRGELGDVTVSLRESDGTLVAEAQTDASGKFEFPVSPEKEYNIIGEKKSYFADRRNYSTMGKTLDKSTMKELSQTVTFETELELDRIVLDKAIVLENIYYDLDKDNIREDAATELDKLVRVLQDNKQITIELSSHTDSRSDDAYNMDLSQRRAQSAVNYLIENGIATERLQAKGYGESQLINGCTNGAECSEEDHQKNRRTEFKVVSVSE